MIQRILVSAVAAVAWTVALAGPALAHGDHDARPLARGLIAGPYTISLWQVYPDAGSAITPHLIVLFDGLRTVPSPVGVGVTVNGSSRVVHPSTTTSNGFETMDGIDVGDRVAITITEGERQWALDPVVVPPPPTSMLPMEELIYGSIFLTIGTAWWMVGRTARAWRRPTKPTPEQAPAT